MKKIAIVFAILLWAGIFGCVATQQSVTSLPTPYVSWDKGKKFLVYNGVIYKKEGRVGTGAIQAERFRVNKNTYIDVIFAGKRVWVYVIMADRAAYEIDVCDTTNYVLVDTDCDGIPDEKILACTPLGVLPECFFEGLE